MQFLKKLMASLLIVTIVGSTAAFDNGATKKLYDAVNNGSLNDVIDSLDKGAIVDSVTFNDARLPLLIYAVDKCLACQREDCLEPSKQIVEELLKRSKHPNVQNYL